MRPLIGINASFSNGSISLNATYVDAVTSAGGIPVVLPPVADAQAARRHVQACDGFVFSGGADIKPSRYGEEPHSTYNPLPERREDYDFRLVEAVLKARKPFLAICLGAQEVNVAIGGSVIQDIADETTSTIGHRSGPGEWPRHEVTVVENTLLHDLVGTTTLVANSYHHQAVREVGRRGLVSARAADGIVEAFELKHYPFGLALQWHPEAMTDTREQLALFRGLVRAAKRPPAGDFTRRGRKSP